MNLNDDKIKYTAECGQPEAPLSNLNRHWATYYHKQGGFKLAAPSCSGFLAWIDPDRFQNGCSRSGDETLFPISTKDRTQYLILLQATRTFDIPIEAGSVYWGRCLWPGWEPSNSSSSHRHGYCENFARGTSLNIPVLQTATRRELQ